jgi:hypothetical protein
VSRFSSDFLFVVRDPTLLQKNLKKVLTLFLCGLHCGSNSTEDLHNENPSTPCSVSFDGIRFCAREAECTKQSKTGLFRQANFTEAWTGFVPWSAIHDYVGRGISRYEEFARLRDGNLAVIGRRQDILNLHCTDRHK